MIHSHTQKIQYFYLLISFKLKKGTFIGVLFCIINADMNYTYHKPQIFRDISRIILCHKTLEEVLEMEKKMMATAVTDAGAKPNCNVYT